MVEIAEEIEINRDEFVPNKCEFLTHANGERPFFVRLESQDQVSVYKQQYTSQSREGAEVAIHTYKLALCIPNLQGVFIAENEDDAELRGNSILLSTENSLEYILISDTIVGFRSVAPIVEFSSTLTHNDVSHPVAVDTEGRYYLLYDMTHPVCLEQIPEEARCDPTRYWVNNFRYDESLQIGNSNHLWYFCCNIDPNHDAKAWHEIQRRSSECKMESMLTQFIFQIFRERHLARGDNQRMSISIEESEKVTALFPRARDLPLHLEENIRMKNQTTHLWEPIDFQRYREIQDAWRDQLKCLPLKAYFID